LFGIDAVADTHLGRPDLITDARFADGRVRFENRAACVQELDAVFAERTLDEWRRVLADVEGVWAPMQSARELPSDPQAIANGYLPEVRTADDLSWLADRYVSFRDFNDLIGVTEQLRLADRYTGPEL